MNNCAEMEEVISEMVFGDIPFDQQEELHGHMADCQGCMDFYLSLFETLADTEGEELAEGLTSKQKAKIFAAARKIDSENRKAKLKEPKPFKWKLPLSIAAAVAVSGIIIVPQLRRSSMDMSAIERESGFDLGYNASYDEPVAEKAADAYEYEDAAKDYKQIRKEAPEINAPTDGINSRSRGATIAAPKELLEQDLLAKSEAKVKSKPGEKYEFRTEYESSKKDDPFKPDLTTVAVDNPKTNAIALEDVSDETPLTDDNLPNEVVSDIVISPSAFAGRSALGGRSKGGRMDSPDNSDGDLVDRGGAGNIIDPAKPKVSKAKEMAEEGLDVIGEKELAKKEEVIEELNKENDDLKNKNGALVAEQRRISKKLEELKELYVAPRGGEGLPQGQSGKKDQEFDRERAMAMAEKERKGGNESEFRSVDTKERAKQLAQQKYSEKKRLMLEAEGEKKKDLNGVDKDFREMARVEEARRQEISQLEENQKKLKTQNVPIFGNDVTRDHTVRRELAMHPKESKGEEMDEKPGSGDILADKIQEDSEKVGKSRLENGVRSQLSFSTSEEDKKKSNLNGKDRRKMVRQEFLDEVEWRWTNPIDGDKSWEDVDGFQYRYFFNNEDSPQIGYIQPKTPNYNLSLDSVFKDEKNKEGKDFTLSSGTGLDTAEADKVAENVIGDPETANLHEIEEAIKQQPELEADNIKLTAEKDFKDGNYENAEKGWLKAIERYKRSGSDTRIVNKIQQIQQKLIELKSIKEPESRRPMIAVDSIPQSTFSIDVDTASYQLFKSAMNRGSRVDPASIRAEEFINYFKYNYEAPKKEAFKVSAEVAASPFHRGSKIIKIGVQGKRPGGDHRAASHFCFIVDTSGSMAAEGRLPLVKKVLPMIVKQMSPGDKVSLISCGLKPRLIVDHMDVGNKEAIYQSIDTLNAVGATNLEASIIDGYNFVLNKVKKGVYSRVVLLSDGVANVGEDDANKILKRLETARQKGVGITVIGMGENEYNDNFLETLADKGDGNYMFIDGGKEAQKAFEENFAATFHTIAYNVKIQVEFDPRQVKSYRLLGYENRRLKNKDFRNDKVDAGEVGSGQSVTAIYELELAENRREGNLCEVRLRYRDAADNKMKEFATPVKGAKAISAFEKISNPTKLAFLVGMFAEVLRDGGTHEGVTVNDILKHMRPLSSEYGDSDVAELLQLMEKSK